MVDYIKIVKEVLESKRRVGDDFDIIERVSLSLEIPRSRAKEVYNSLNTKRVG